MHKELATSLRDHLDFSFFTLSIFDNCDYEQFVRSGDSELFKI